MPGKQQVESSLADLAISTISDRIPNLLDAYLGFELIASNDDNVKAAGIAGFMIGQDMIYIPALFLNGKIKGTECLYLKKDDIFVSCSKQWIEYLTTRTPGRMGQAAVPPPGLSGPAPAQMRVFTQPPMIGGKIASLDDLSIFPDIDQLPGWKDCKWNKTGTIFPDAYDFMNRLHKTAMRDQVWGSEPRPEFNLPNVLQSMGKQAYVEFMNWTLENPVILEKLGQYYDWDSLKLAYPEGILPEVEDIDNSATAGAALGGATSSGPQLSPAGWNNQQEAKVAAMNPSKTSVAPGVLDQIGSLISNHKLLAGGAGAAVLGGGALAYALSHRHKKHASDITCPACKGEVKEKDGKKVCCVCQHVCEEPAEPKELKLARYNFDDLEKNPSLFTIEQREQIVQDGYLVMDKRAAEEKTPLYREEYMSRFDVPHENGYYEIVNKYGELRKVFLVTRPFIAEAPQTTFSGKIIVDLESGIFQTTNSDQEVLIRTQYKTEDAVWKEKAKNLPSISSAEVGKTYLLVSPDLKEVSAPFHVKNKSGSGKDLDMTIRTPYSVRYRADSGDNGLWDSEPDSVKIVDKDGPIQRLGDRVFIPKDFKLIELDDDSDRYSYTHDDSKQEKKNIYRDITPGTNSTLTGALLARNFFDLDISKTASGDYIASIGKHASPFCNKTDMNWVLMGKLGVSADDAQYCLEQTDLNGRMKCQVKLAYNPNDVYSPGTIFGGDPLPPVDNELGVNNSGVKEVYPQQQFAQVNMNNPEVPGSDPLDNDSANWDRIKPQQMDFLQRAADSGSQKVFDPAMIGTILRTSRSSAQVEQWLPDLVSALDTKCRLLILFYWHNEDFAEDYDKTELNSFEDALLSSIDVDGKVVLFLKQKSGNSNSANINAFEGD